MEILNKQDIKFEGDGYVQFRIPGIVCTESGVLLCYFECRESKESDLSVSDIGLVRSLDNGKSWEPMKIIASGDSVNVSNNPVMIVDENTVHFIWMQNYKRAYYSKSEDDGLTWSAPRDITDTFEAVRPGYAWTVIAAGPGHGIKLKSGRLLLPIWMASNRSYAFAHKPSVCGTMYSDDHGATWKLGKIISSPDVFSPNESDVAELDNGRIIINIRHKNPDEFFRYTAYSDDGGESFGELIPVPELIDQHCDAGLFYCKNALYYSGCADKTERLNLTLCKSVDGGKTWGEKLCIEEFGGYSDLTYQKDTDSLIIFYEYKRGEILRLAKIKI